MRSFYAPSCNTLRTPNSNDTEKILNWVEFVKMSVQKAGIGRHLSCNWTHPGTPPDSMWLASVTSSLHTSNCHLRKPSTPHRTLPVCIPILISTLNPVASRTNLQKKSIMCRISSKGDSDGYIVKWDDHKCWVVCICEETVLEFSKVLSRNSPKEPQDLSHDSSNPTEIRTMSLWNKRPEICRYTNPLGSENEIWNPSS
jgi:hypothetical protein